MKHILQTVIGMLLLAASVTLPAATAGAHTGFDASEPAEQSVVEEAVDEIELRFTGPADPVGEGFVVLDPTAAIRQPNRITSNTDSSVWTLTFEPPLAGGMVGLRWTVQAPDSHPISGSFSFTVATAEPGDSIPGDNDGGSGGATSTGSTDQGVASATTAVATSAPAAEPEPTSTGATASTTAVDSTAPSVTQPTDQPAAPTGDVLAAFLFENQRTTTLASEIATAGRAVGLIAAMVALGGLVFAGAVLGHRPRDRRCVLRAARSASAFVIVGAAIEVLAQLVVVQRSWTQAWTLETLDQTLLTSFGVAVALRAAGGTLMFAAPIRARIRPGAEAEKTTSAAVPVGAAATATSAATTATATASGPGGTWSESLDADWQGDGSGLESGRGPGSGIRRPVADLPVSAPFVLGAVLLVVSFTFDGHTASEGIRWLTGLIDVVHLLAGAVWAGGVFSLAIVLWRRRQMNQPLLALDLVVRFSVIAAASLAAAGFAGLQLTVIMLDSPSELWSTDWGQALVVKIALVAVAAIMGGYNHFRLLPRMTARRKEKDPLAVLRVVVTIEAMIFVAVMALTAVMVGASIDEEAPKLSSVDQTSQAPPDQGG